MTVVWSVCYLFMEEKALEAVMSTNGVTKILLLLQSNCSAAVRRMLTDLLKVFKVCIQDLALQLTIPERHISCRFDSFLLLTRVL